MNNFERQFYNPEAQKPKTEIENTPMLKASDLRSAEKVVINTYSGNQYVLTRSNNSGAFEFTNAMSPSEAPCYLYDNYENDDCIAEVGKPFDFITVANLRDSKGRHGHSSAVVSIEISKGNNAKKVESGRKVKLFKTAKGSVYTYDSDNKTTRFKTVTGEQNDRQDITVFLNLAPQEEQDILMAYRGYEREGVKVYVIERKADDNVKVIRDVKEVENKDRLYLAIVSGSTVETMYKASLEPKVGANVFDFRTFYENGERMSERHLGNKVVDIEFEE